MYYSVPITGYVYYIPSYGKKGLLANSIGKNL